MIVAGLILCAVGGAGFLAKLAIGPNLADRVISLDGILTVVVCGIVAWAGYTGSATFLIFGVVVSLVAFLGTSIFARFVEGRQR